MLALAYTHGDKRNLQEDAADFLTAHGLAEGIAFTALPTAADLADMFRAAMRNES